MEPFRPLEDIPYYYPCNFPLIHEVLRRQHGFSSLGLLAGARLYGLPACSSEGLVKTYFNKLNYKEAIWLMNGYTELGGLQEGLELARELTARGELMLTTGTSYYLPYCEDYLNPVYISKLTDPQSRLYLVDHWLAVYGVSETEVHIYDPVPARFKGSLPIPVFDAYWKGNQCIPELAAAKRREELHSYCTVSIAPEAPLSAAAYEEALLRVLLTHVHEFLAGREVESGGRTYFFGHAVSLKLLRQLAQGLPRTDQAAFSQASGFLFDMRWSRYFFRDLLYDVVRLPGDGFTAFAEEFDHLIRSWEHAHKLLVSSAVARREGESVTEVLDVIGKLVNQEYSFYERLQAYAGGAAPLLEQEGEDSEESASISTPNRDELLRIVLDGCQEIAYAYSAKAPGELGGHTPLYGRDGFLDSLGLVSLLAVVEQSVEEELGARIALSDRAAQQWSNNPFRTVDSLVAYLKGCLEEAG
ncbi:hypothetical protein [Paenibacillus sp. PL2-23]|uniref:hypothetical protein n=1 Tax=Paenibacillus sp. PL2-23 TaxID=2100729 RepID=UPI0030FD0B9E